MTTEPKNKQAMKSIFVNGLMGSIFMTNGLAVLMAYPMFIAWGARVVLVACALAALGVILLIHSSIKLDGIRRQTDQAGEDNRPC